MYYYGEQSLGKGNQPKPSYFLLAFYTYHAHTPLHEKDIISHHIKQHQKQNKHEGYQKKTQIEQSIYETVKRKKETYI